MTSDRETEPLRVVVVGGGIGGLETVLALQDLAGARVAVTLVAPSSQFIVRALAVATPFSRGHSEALDLSTVMAELGGSFVHGALVAVDSAAQTIALADGRVIGFDHLVLALGATPRPAYARALTLGGDLTAFGGVLSDMEHGWSRSLAFVVPPGTTWPLPLYEVALMTAEEVWSMGIEDAEFHFVTPEHSPLDVFGTEPSDVVAKLLDDAGITFHGGQRASVTRNGHVSLGDGRELAVDRVVALPTLEGPRLEGLPADEHGFIPVDAIGLVRGTTTVYAVGDASDRPIKQGGLACQQADVAATHIAVAAGADIQRAEGYEVLRARLLTGGRDEFLERFQASGKCSAGHDPLWFPPSKVVGRYLTPYLAVNNVVRLPVLSSQKAER